MFSLRKKKTVNTVWLKTAFYLELYILMLSQQVLIPNSTIPLLSAEKKVTQVPFYKDFETPLTTSSIIRGCSTNSDSAVIRKARIDWNANYQNIRPQHCNRFSEYMRKHTCWRVPSKDSDQPAHLCRAD